MIDHLMLRSNAVCSYRYCSNLLLLLMEHQQFHNTKWLFISWYPHCSWRDQVFSRNRNRSHNSDY